MGVANAGGRRIKIAQPDSEEPDYRSLTWLPGQTASKGHSVMAFFYVETGSYSGTFLFHMIPGITETSTRLPLGAPLLANVKVPELKVATGVLFVLFFIGATLQVRRLHTRNAALAGALVAPAP